MADTDLRGVVAKWYARIGKQWGIVAEMKVPVSELRDLCAAASQLAEARAELERIRAIGSAEIERQHLIINQNAEDWAELRVEYDALRRGLEQAHRDLAASDEARAFERERYEVQIQALVDALAHAHMQGPVPPILVPRDALIDTIRAQLSAQAEELAKLRAALEPLAQAEIAYFTGFDCWVTFESVYAARAALAAGAGEGER